jgi:hypothetical protein
VIDTSTGEVLDKSFPGLVALLNAQFASVRYRLGLGWGGGEGLGGVWVVCGGGRRQSDTRTEEIVDKPFPVRCLL